MLHELDLLSTQERDEYVSWVQGHPEASVDLLKRQRGYFWRRSRIGEQRAWILKRAHNLSHSKRRKAAKAAFS
jgi:hypothetical protein